MMMLKKFPVPVCGLALGVAALGNLLLPFGVPFRYVCGSIAFCLVLAVTVRMLTDFSQIRKELENPVVFSVLPAYTMTLMLLSGYAKPFIGTIALLVWFFALTLHFVITAAFVKTFVIKFDIKQVFPSWFVMFVGVVVASVTSPAMEQQGLGRLVFFVGFVFYMALLPVVLYRVLKIGGIPEPAKPATVIFCAPASLCFIGYMSAFDEKSSALAAFLGALCVMSWFAVVFSMPGLLKLPFYPSYAAFTFPLVISANAFRVAGGFFSGAASDVFGVLSPVAMILASGSVIYVLVRYCMFWFPVPKPERQAVSKEN